MGVGAIGGNGRSGGKLVTRLAIYGTVTAFVALMAYSTIHQVKISTIYT